MKNLAFLISALLLTSSAIAQVNMTLLGHYVYQDTINPVNKELSDVWGYVDEDDNEYALVGVHDGFSIIDVTDPANPDSVYWLDGPPSIWRDMKVWGDYAYITTEGGGGLQIVDMTPLPGAPISVTNTYTGSNYPFSSAHNIWIDENGFAYIFGANYGEGGAIILDLNNNPLVPQEVGVFDQFYIHDGFVRGDTLWCGAINDGFSALVDVSDKANCQVMGTWDTPNVFSHNIWPSDDSKYAFTTDEVGSGFIASYDVTDLSNVEELDRFQSNPGTGVIPHNTHYLNRYLVTSYYADGIVITDANREHNLIEVGNYDTSPDYSGYGFNGSWGCYPFLPSGNVLAADIEEGLLILGGTYQRACYLEGVVTDSTCNAPIANAKVNISGTTIETYTDADGSFATGTVVPGTYTIVFSKPGYQASGVANVSLTNGVLTTVDVKLFSTTTVDLGGLVQQDGGSAIANAIVTMDGTANSYNFTTDQTGHFDKCNVVSDTFDVVASRWGFVTFCDEVVIDSTNSELQFDLARGYYDDFTTDLGWTVSGAAADGAWQRGEPVGTWFNGGTENPNPDVDIDSDCGDGAFVTGNAGGGAGNDDVDGGSTWLSSPLMDLTLYKEPRMQFYYWFYNGGGSGAPNDYMRAYLTNGTDTALILEVDTSVAMSEWLPFSIDVDSTIALTDHMQLMVEARDDEPGHLVEGAIDGFQVIDESGQAVGLENTIVNLPITVYPNPFTNSLTFDLPEGYKNVQVQLLDISGKLLQSGRLTSRGSWHVDAIPAGLYFVRLLPENGMPQTLRVIRQ